MTEKMTTISLTAQFVEALHSLNMGRVKATRTYQVMCMCDAPEKIDTAIEHMFEHLRGMRDSDPERWEAIIRVVAEEAAAERARCGTEFVQTKVTESVDLPPLKGANPRNQRPLECRKRHPANPRTNL